jgi:cell division protein FtsB
LAKTLNTAMRVRRRGFVTPVLCALVVGYFAYHVFHGEHGIAAWQNLEREAARLEAELEEVNREHAALERRVFLMRPQSLDADLLDQQVRAILGWAHPDELTMVRHEAR